MNTQLTVYKKLYMNFWYHLFISSNTHTYNTIVDEQWVAEMIMHWWGIKGPKDANNIPISDVKLIKHTTSSLVVSQKINTYSSGGSHIEFHARRPLELCHRDIV